MGKQKINAPNNSGMIVGGNVKGSIYLNSNAAPPGETPARRGLWVWVERMTWVAGILVLPVAVVALPLVGEWLKVKGWLP